MRCYFVTALAALLLAAAPAPAQFVDAQFRSGGLGILRPRVDVRVQGGFPGYYPGYYGGFPYYPAPVVSPFVYPYGYGAVPWGYPYAGGFGGGRVICGPSGCFYVP